LVKNDYLCDMMELVKLNFVDSVEGVEAFSTARGLVEGRNAYSGVNLCDYVGDDALRVLDARISLAMQLGIDLDDLIMPRQTHSCRVAVIDERFRSLDIDRQEVELEGVDALVTTLRGVAIGVNTADCVPIVLADKQAGVLGVVHAGWRGTVGRIARAAVEEMCRQGAVARHLQVAMGPSICQKCFEVGDEVVAAFSQAHFDMASIVVRNAHTGKAHIDLRIANRDVLVDAGVPSAQIVLSQHCSRCEHERFFSARRLGTASGRTFTGIIGR
jgi:YfiH family protein